MAESKRIRITHSDMSKTYIVGTFNEIPGTDKTNFVILGTFPDKNAAKASINNLAPAVMQNQYRNGVSLFELDHKANKIYTFDKKDLKTAYDVIQKQQTEQLERQRQQLEAQKSQIQKQIDDLKSGF